MRSSILLFIALCVASPSLAGPRVGGDTIETAVVIPALPYLDTGTTQQALDDYDEPCSWGGIGSPDVVYALELPADTYVTVDLCGSTYDTRVYVYDAARTTVGCNDDTGSTDYLCSRTDSRIDALLLEAGAPYYIVVDGFGGHSGGYVLEVRAAGIPVLGCPAGAQAEGEPPPVFGVDDAYNCGCACAILPDRFQKLPVDATGSTFACLRSNWNGYPGAPVFDEDWLTVFPGPEGRLHFELAAERATELMVRKAACDPAVFYGFVTASANAPAVLDVRLAPGTPVWVVLTPSPFFDPGVVLPLAYGMLLTIEGQATTTAAEASSWGRIKAAYR